jgi:hypothetical protein
MENNTAQISTVAVRAMVSKWLTGNDESDAKSLRCEFRSIGLSLNEWRTIIAETKAAG